MTVYAEDSLQGLLDQIDEWTADKQETVVITTQDLRLLKECYEETLDELNQLYKEQGEIQCQK